MIAALNSATFIPGLILGIVIAIALMRAATSFQQRWGRPPWGVPPWAWLVIGLILGLLGAALYLIAHATTKSRLTRYPAPPPQYGSAYPPPPLPPQGAPTWAPPASPAPASPAPVSPDSVPPAPPTGDPTPPPPPEQATPPAQ